MSTTVTVSPLVYRVSVNEVTNLVTVSSPGPQGPAGSGAAATITSGTLDGGLASTTTFNQITDLFIDGSAFDGGEP